jgi:hypothetical protein
MKSDAPPDMWGAALRLVEQGGPFVVVTVTLSVLCYFGWKLIVKPMLDSNAEQMKNHVIASQNHMVAAQANERLGQTLTNAVTRMEAMRP